jgi:NhaP-type Na+/H+ or K+/H+ antiporter
MQDCLGIEVGAKNAFIGHVPKGNHFILLLRVTCYKLADSHFCFPFRADIVSPEPFVLVETTVTLIALLIVLCSFCQWLAWRVKLPAIIFLLATGVLLGPALGLLHPDRLLGNLLFPFVSLSVAVVLFEGSLTLRYREIIGLEAVVRNLVSFGMLATCIITAVATRLALGLPWELCLLFGAITVVTGPTVIIPMLRTVRPTANVARILRWEGIIIDPLGAALAVLVYEFIISGGGQEALGHTLLMFGQIVLIGSLIGALGGYLFGLVLRNHWLPEFLHNVTALALVFGTFALADTVQHESGLVTVTVMGIWLANMDGVEVEDILDFKESLSILLVSILFIVLAARMDFANVAGLGWRALSVFLAIQFLARPINVMLSAFRSRLSWPERHLLAWIAPRGIVAAAISALFALRLEQMGMAGAPLLIPLTFMVIIGTVLLQSLTARPLALWLKVAEPEPKGFLIVGANKVARMVGKALDQRGFPVLLADPDWENVAKARMEGLPAYFGNPISEHADRHLDLVGIGRMLALTSRENFNVAAVMHFRMEFGRKNVFVLQREIRDKNSEKLQVTPRRRGRPLFSEGVTYSTLTEMLARGAEMHATKLTESFSFDDFLKKHRPSPLVLFAIDTRDRLKVFTADNRIAPGPGWTVISLIIGDRSEPENTENATPPFSKS